MQNNFLRNYKNDGVFIIAEIGVNHNGDIITAFKLIEIAKKCGADAVKFQTFNTDKLVDKNTPMAEYQKNNLDEQNTTQYDMIKKLEISKDDFFIIKKYCDKLNIIFISTPFDTDSVDILEELQVPFYKVGSGDCDNYLLLNKIIKTNKPVIISLGMTNMDDIIKIKKFMDINNYENKYVFLHCVSSYPTPHEETNVSCIKSLSKQLNIPVGFSDHTIDSIAGIMSVGYDVVCIEKHITLDNNMIGPDHKASLNPERFDIFVKNIRIAEKAKGNGEKCCTESERNTQLVAKKKLIYNCDLNEGDIVEYDNLDAIRIINGIGPDEYSNFVGKRMMKNVKKNNVVSYDDIEKYDRVLYGIDNVNLVDVTEEIYYYLKMNIHNEKNVGINEIIGFDPFMNREKKLFLFSKNKCIKLTGEKIQFDFPKIKEFDTNKLDDLFNINAKSRGFIILRHVNNKKTDAYWKKSYESIRKFYGNIKIVMIDDNSNYDYVDKNYEEKMLNVEIIKSEFHGRGELLPYYYYLKYKFFDIACIIHDSVFVNKHVDFFTKDYITLWCAKTHLYDDVVEEKRILKVYDEAVNIFYDDKNKWDICFGGMTIINYDFLHKVNEKYNFEKLLNLISSRKERMCFERIIACLLGTNSNSKKCLFGDIHSYCKWEMSHDEYINGDEKTRDLPFIKIWSGR